MVTEIAVAERSTPLSFTPPNALTLTLVPFDSGQECLVPLLPRAVYLFGQAIVDLDTAVLDASTELAIADRSDATLLANLVIQASHGPGNGNGSTVTVWHRIPPNTPGARYFLFSGSSNAGPVTILGQPHAHPILTAFY